MALRVRTSHHVTIGSEFFAKAFNDYAKWQWALVREFFQNCIDCGSSRIRVIVEDRSGETYMVVENDGEAMTEEILIDKLFCLGGSGKNFESGATGGFGKAKELLYFCHKEYEILSGDLIVKGSGAAYELEASDTFFNGTRSTILIDGCHQEEIVKQIERFIRYAQWSGEFVVNGHSTKASMRKGSPRRDLGFGQVYTNRQNQYLMVVRINGVPMFIERTGLDRLVIVELKGNSDEVMTSNRDGLVDPFCSELSDFVTELAVDKKSALKSRRGPRYTHYRGSKLCHTSQLDVMDVVALEETQERAEYPGEEGIVGSPELVDATPNSGAVEGVDIDGNAVVHGPIEHVNVVRGGHGSAAAFSVEEPKPRREVATLGSNFVVKNETDLKIPAYYDPGSGEFSSYSHKLVRFWGRIMLELHRLFDHEDEFSIGFIFEDGTVEAEHEDADYGRVYYLNPCKVVEQEASYSKSFRKRFKLTERDRLIMVGLHEFVHGLGLGWHDERYANRLTDMAGKVMANRKRFNWCFK